MSANAGALHPSRFAKLIVIVHQIYLACIIYELGSFGWFIKVFYNISVSPTALYVVNKSLSELKNPLKKQSINEMPEASSSVIYACDQICQKDLSYTCTVSRYTFHRHLVATSIRTNSTCVYNTAEV